MNEHYVPQLYLRRFAPVNEGLISMVSLTETHYGGGYCSNDGYSVRKSASEEGFANGFFEKSPFTDMEDYITPIFEKLVHNETLTETECGALSRFIAFQFERTPEQKQIYEIQNLLREYTGSFNLGNRFADWRHATVDATKHAHKRLQHYGWVVVENRTEEPFLTSDTPVVSYVDTENVSSDVSAVDREIFYPIDPEHALVLLHPDRFKVHSLYPSAEVKRMCVDSVTDVRRMNCLQVLSSSEEVFGPVGNTEYITEMIELTRSEVPSESHVRGPQCSNNRFRLAVLVTLGEYDRLRSTHWYESELAPVITAFENHSEALHVFTHELEFVTQLRRESQISVTTRK